MKQKFMYNKFKVPYFGFLNAAKDELLFKEAEICNSFSVCSLQ